MRAALLTFFAVFVFAVPQTPESKLLTSGLDTSLRGLSSDHANGTEIIWASGSNGVILRSLDAGKSWTRLHIDNADTQDFRGVRSFGADIAYVFSVGTDNQSHIYKTSDGGKTWRTQYSDPRPAFFLDGLVCRSEKDCFAISDPIDGKFPIFHTEDGEHWTELPKDSEPSALPTEGLFAASNTSLVFCSPNNKDIFFGTGGPAARVFHSADNGHSWTVASSPILSGNTSAGIFSIACSFRTVVAVGGDYRNPAATKSVAAYSTDLGATWQPSTKPPTGYRSAVIAIPPGMLTTTTWIAVGTNGVDTSIDNGAHWSPLDYKNLNAVLAFDPDRVLTASPKGAIDLLTIYKRIP